MYYATRVTTTAKRFGDRRWVNVTTVEEMRMIVAETATSHAADADVIVVVETTKVKDSVLDTVWFASIATKIQTNKKHKKPYKGIFTALRRYHF